MERTIKISPRRVHLLLFLMTLTVLSACLPTRDKATTSESVAVTAVLSNLRTSSGVLTPSFSSSQTAYSATTNAASIRITPTATEASAQIQVNNETVVSGNPSSSISLPIGSTPLTTTITSSDGEKKDYIVVVTRQSTQSSDSYLSSITLSEGTVSPSLRHSTTSYTASVANSTESIFVSATPENNDSTLEINGSQVSSGAELSVALSVGSNNVIQFLVKATNGDERSYTLIVTRAEPVIDYFESQPEKGYALCDPYGSIQISTDPNYYFMLTATDGSRLYVKQTVQLKINEQGQLVDKYNGYPIEPQITIPTNMVKLDITPEGFVEVTSPGNSSPSVCAQLAIASFPNPAGLEKVAGPDGAMAQQLATQQLQQANMAMITSLSSGLRINTAADSDEGSYYVQTDDSGTPNTSSPDASLFGTAISYCGTLSVPQAGSVKLEVGINGDGLIELQQSNGTSVYYVSNNGFTLVNDANGRLIEPTTGLPIMPSLTIPSDVLIETLSLDANGIVTVTRPDNSIMTVGQLILSTFESPSELTHSRFNPSVFQPTATSGQATTSTPGSNSAGTLTLLNRQISAPTIVPNMEIHTATYSYQSTPSDMCGDGRITIEITDLTHFFKFTDPISGNPYYKRGQQEVTKDATGLITDLNGYVLDPGITVPQETTKLAILPNGAVLVYLPGSEQPLQIGTIQVYSAVSGFDPAPGMDGYYVENTTPMASAPMGSLSGTSIAYCGGRVLEDQQNNIINDRVTINMEIQGACFFQLSDIDGTSAYTRNNKFVVDPSGVIREASSGLILQPQITIPNNAVTVSVASDGTVNVALDDLSTQQVGQISLTKFMSVASLSKSVENYLILAQSAGSGSPTQGPAGQNGCGSISFGSLGSRSDYNNVTDILFTHEQDNLQKLDDVLAAFAPPTQVLQQLFLLQ